MLKKLLSMALCATMVMGIGTTAFAEETNDNVITSIHRENIESLGGHYGDETVTKTLYDLAGNKFDLIETGNNGYYIFDNTSGKYLEESIESPSPYLGLDDNLYYFGPMNYYQKTGDIFDHTILPTDYNFASELSADFQSGFSNKLDNVRAEKNTELLSLINQRNTSMEDIQTYFDNTRAATNKYIPSYSYIKNAVYPENATGTCGYTAACIVFNYWHKLKGNVINNTFLDSNGNLKTSGTTLQDKLIEYGGGTSSSWGKTIRDAMIDYCNAYGVGATSTYYVTNFDIFAEVGRGRPVIVFGYFPNDPSPLSARGNVMHAVTAYGTHTEGIISKLIVHYGWKGYEQVLLDSGLVGSSTQFVLN